MNTSEAAAAIGTDARTLRRFLRAEPSYNNPGSSGRYVFESRDIPTMKRLFEKWATTGATPRSDAPKAKPAPIVAEPKEDPTEDPNYDLEFGYFGHIPTRLRGDALHAENARVARLEYALRRTGKHISQHRSA